MPSSRVRMLQGGVFILFSEFWLFHSKKIKGFQPKLKTKPESAFSLKTAEAPVLTDGDTFTRLHIPCKRYLYIGSKRKIDYNISQTSENRFNFFDRHTISGAAARGKICAAGRELPWLRQPGDVVAGQGLRLRCGGRGMSAELT